MWLVPASKSLSLPWQANQLKQPGADYWPAPSETHSRTNHRSGWGQRRSTGFARESE